jgi:hypothetical protein
MAKIVPISTMAEILFDNSEEIPNNIYIHIMNLTKRYYDHGDNEEELIEAISKLHRKIQSKIIYKPFCTCNCYYVIDFICLIRRFMYIFMCIIMFISFLGAIMYCIATKNTDQKIFNSPPPKY